MNSRTQNPWMHRLLLLGGALLLILVIVGIPFLYDLLTREPAGGDTWYTRLVVAAMKGSTVAYFFFIGSAVGSFINVVVYRMPLGKSVVTTPSACPRCRSRIHGRDNIPVFGWIMLGGRCRKCGLPISARYPLVELWFGLFALVLLMFELIVGATNIPGVAAPFRAGVSEIIWFLKWKIIGVYAFHCFLIATLSTWALFKLDRNRVPLLAGALPFLTAIALSAAVPHLHPVLGFRLESMDPLFNQVCSPILGGLIGIGLGLGIEKLTASAGFNPFPNKGFWLAAGLTGAVLGWQATLSACLLFALLFFFSRFIVDLFVLARGPLLGLFTLAVLGQICLWRPLSEIRFWPGNETGIISTAVGLLATIGLILAAKHLIPGGDQLEDFQAKGYGQEVPDLFESRVSAESADDEKSDLQESGFTAIDDSTIQNKEQPSIQDEENHE